MRKLLLLIALAVIPAAAFGQIAANTSDLSDYGVKIDADKRLIVVLAALEMARGKNEAGQDIKIINTPLSESGKSFRERLLRDNQGLDAELRSRISVFVTQYKKRHPAADDAAVVSPFISMAYALSPLPEMYDPAFTGDLPGELLDVLDFAPLAREFYRRSGIGSRLDEYVKLYRDGSEDVLRPSSRQMVRDLLDYMHTRPEIFYVEKVRVETRKGRSKSGVIQNTESRDRERRFMIVPELLAPVGTVNFLNIKDDYFVIVPPNRDLGFSEVRRAFIQFVVDPLIAKNSKDVLAIRDSVKPLLDERRKSDPGVSPDIYLTVSRSLVAAIDARQLEYTKTLIATQRARAKLALLKTDAEKRAVTAELELYKKTLADETALDLSEAYERGGVLAFYFADQLRGTEDSGFDIASSMREMIASFDASKETDRLSRNAEARARGLAARTARKAASAVRTPIAENPVTVRLLSIQKTIESKDLARAEADLRKLETEYPSDPRVYYNIGRLASLTAEGLTDAAALENKLLEAKEAYSRVIKISSERLKTDTKEEAESDQTLLSLSLVALGRIYEFAENTVQAIILYDEAIKLGPVPEGAYDAAVAGRKRLAKSPQ